MRTCGVLLGDEGLRTDGNRWRSGRTTCYAYQAALQVCMPEREFIQFTSVKCSPAYYYYNYYYY